MRRVIVTGTIAFDHIMNLPSRFKNYIMPDKIHMLNVSFQADDMRQEMGGTGGNIAYNLGLLEMKPVLLSAAGEDFEGYRNRLETAGVDCSRVKVYKGELCSSGFCITDQDDNQIWSFSFNASRHMRELSLDFGSDHSNPLVVISPSSPNGINHFVDQCRRLKLSYLFDPAFNIPDLTQAQLVKGIKGAKIVIGNDYEVELMKRKTGMSMEQMVEDGRILITTLGGKGSRIEFLEANSYKLKAILIPPAKPKNTIDPTGAGDAFRAGFLAGYLRDMPLEICGRMGSLASVYTVEKYGTTTHKYSMEKFKKRYRENFDAELSF